MGDAKTARAVGELFEPLALNSIVALSTSPSGQRASKDAGLLDSTRA